MVGSALLFLLGSARADILNVTLSNLVFAGNQRCGAGFLCTLTVNASFQWNTTSNTYVSNSLSFAVSNNSTNLTFPSPATVTGGAGVYFGQAIFTASLASQGNDANLSIQIASSGSTLQPGTYTYDTAGEFQLSPTVAPGTYLAQLTCQQQDVCYAEYPILPMGPVVNIAGTNASSGTVTISTASPNPVGTAVGVYRSGNGLFILNSQYNNMFTSQDTITSFTGTGLTPLPGDIPVAGDWSGTGRSKIGIYRPSTGTWFLDWNGNGVYDGPVIDRQYQYGGVSSDVPIVGDWNGTGTSKVGIFRQGFLFLLNTTGTGSFGSSDSVFAFGGLSGCTGPLPGYFNVEPPGSCDIPVVGDWNKSGSSKVGVVRAAPGTSQPFLWILDTTGAHTISGASTVFAFGGIQGDIPIVGDWKNTGNTQVGVFRNGFFWVEDTTANLPAIPAPGDTLLGFPYGGVPGDEPIVGKW